MLDNDHKTLSDLIQEVKEDLTGYLQLQIKYFKLKTYEKSSMLLSFVGYGITLILIIVTMAMLILIALGLLLGEVVNSYALGFAILVLVVLIILVVTILFAKNIRRSFTNLFLSIIQKTIDDDEEQNFTS